MGAPSRPNNKTERNSRARRDEGMGKVHQKIDRETEVERQRQRDKGRATEAERERERERERQIKTARDRDVCVCRVRGERARLYSRVHGHGGEFGVDVFAGRIVCVAGERLWRVQPVLAAEVQRGEGALLPHLVQVGLGSDEHTRCLAVHEVALQQNTG